MQVFYCTRAFLVKLDGYRALAMKSGGNVQLRSRNDNDFNVRYTGIVKAILEVAQQRAVLQADA